MACHTEDFFHFPKIPMQSGNASITKKALVQIHEHLKGKDAHIIGTVHDEIIVEAHKDITDEVFEIVKGDMIEAGLEYITKVPVRVKGAISECWSK